MLELTAGHYHLLVDPPRGGSVAAFTWRDRPIFRPSIPGSVLDTACFPLVPFSNRIARGRIPFGADVVTLPANAPEADMANPLHGYGWLADWEVIDATPETAILEHAYEGGEWPWHYSATQHFALAADGLTMRLSVTNRSDAVMPAGLGFHPYFPRSAQTLYRGLHRGEWQVDDGCLPVSLSEADVPKDWWNGQPVSSRVVDTAFAGRAGDLLLAWPEIDLHAIIVPSDNLPCTVVYTPEAEDFFCVEPVSHTTDAINRSDTDFPMASLAPGETMTASMQIAASAWGRSQVR